MLTLADLLNPLNRPPSQRRRAPEAVMVEADVPAKPGSNTANEQIPSVDARSPGHFARTTEPSSPVGSTVSDRPGSSGVPASLSDANRFARLSQHELPPSKQPRASKPISRPTIDYNGRKWEYRGCRWLKRGILALRLMPVESNESIELVRERDVHLDNEMGLLNLWKSIRRPKAKNKMYQPLKILDETEDEKYETHWTGFDEESNTLEPVSKMWKVAPDLVEEYYRQRQYAGNKPVKHHTKRRANGAAASRAQLPPGPIRQPAHRPRARGSKRPSTRQQI